MSQTGYDLLHASTRRSLQYNESPLDPAAPLSTLNRIALVASERIMLLMNNTQLLTRHHRLSNMGQVVDYLLGLHDDFDCNGDRGDFYRRKLAEQIYVNFGVHYITHNNVLDLVSALIKLEHDTRLALEKYGAQRCSAPFIEIDSQVLDVLARIANIH